LLPKKRQHNISPLSFFATAKMGYLGEYIYPGFGGIAENTNRNKFNSGRVMDCICIAAQSFIFKAF
jgi:hypothetical protein